MSNIKKNSKCKESICELDLPESVIWSLLEKRIEDLNTLETISSSKSSSSDILESKDMFETFTLMSSNLYHFTTPKISVSTKE